MPPSRRIRKATVTLRASIPSRWGLSQWDVRMDTTRAVYQACGKFGISIGLTPLPPGTPAAETGPGAPPGEPAAAGAGEGVVAGDGSAGRGAAGLSRRGAG